MGWEQIGRFDLANYIPLPWSMSFHAAAREADRPDGPVMIGCGGARGPGKALALDTPIPTPMGWTEMGRLRVGDAVFAPDGTPTEVTGVSEVFSDHPCYEVVFSDGAVIVADADHLWHVYNKSDRSALHRRSDAYRARRRSIRPTRSKGLSPRTVVMNQQRVHEYKPAPTGRVVTTAEMATTLKRGREANYSVLATDPLELPDATLPIDPYVLGAWLGDGDSNRGYLTSNDQEIVDRVRSVGYAVEWRGKLRYSITGLRAELKAGGLLGNKHVPSEYLRGSRKQRLEILNGLMDTDGCVDKDGACEFTSTNYQLARGVMELALTLGAKPTIAEGRATLNGKYISPKWRVRFTADFPAFHLTRKRDKQKRNATRVTKWRYVVEVNRVDSVAVRCITVAHSSHCYLAGDRFVTTHNSHTIMAQVGLDDCQRFNGLKWLFLRRVQKSAAESFDDLVRKVFSSMPCEVTAGRVMFANDSRILIGGYNNERDIDKYLGIEYDGIVLEEGTQITGDKRDKIRGSLRTGRSDWRPRWYESTNPGGIGHGDFKNLYVIPYRKHEETTTRFFPSTYRDNPFLNKEYVDYLLGLKGALGQAWRDGDWDIFEGMAFSSFRWERHTCKPFEIPAHWSKWRAVDWGFRNPFACVWIAKDPDTGRLYVYRELYQAGLTDRQQARAIKDNTPPGEKISITFADPSMWAKKNINDMIRSSAEEYAAEGVILTKANNERLPRKRKLDTLLADLPDGRPGIIFFDTCVDCLRTIPELPYSNRNIEDVDSEAEDHAYDALTYGLTAINTKPQAPRQIITVTDPLAQRVNLNTTGVLTKDF